MVNERYRPKEPVPETVDVDPLRDHITKKPKKTNALRFNQGKPMMGYILHYPSVMEIISRIMEYGALKYNEMNWKKGGKPDKEYLDAAMRHLTQWVNGIPFDGESGCSHLGQAIWNLITLLQNNYPDQIVDFNQFNLVIDKLKEGRELKCQQNVNQV